MSTYAVAPAPPKASLRRALPVVAGATLLLARVDAPMLGAARVPALGVAYCALLALSLRPAGTSGATGAIPPAVAALAGVAVVTAVAFAPWRSPLPSHDGAAAVGFGVLAAIAEEAFFRRLLYAWLAPIGAGAAVVGTAVAFALVHVPLYGVDALWLDLGAGLLLSWQRWASGDWRAPAVTHAFANVLVAVR